MWITLPLLGEFPALVDAQRHGVASFNGIVTGSPAGFGFYRIFFMVGIMLGFFSRQRELFQGFWDEIHRAGHVASRTDLILESLK